MGQWTVPEYRRIRDFLSAQLEAGELVPGDRIPTERELVERFGVAHMTVRHAVDGLVRDGLLARRRGSGTFVVRTRATARSINRLQSFTKDVGESAAGAKVITLRESEPTPEVSEHLEMSGKGRVFELTRLRTIDGSAASINRVWLPVRLCPELINQDMNDRSLYDYLAAIGLRPHHAEQRLFASSAEKWQSDLLDVPVGTALLGSERVTRDAGNIAIEYALSWSRPDLSVWVEMTS